MGAGLDAKLSETKTFLTLFKEAFCGEGPWYPKHVTYEVLCIFLIISANKISKRRQINMV